MTAAAVASNCCRGIGRGSFGRCLWEWRWWRWRCKIIGYRSDEGVFHQIFVVLSYDGFRLLQRSKSPLNLEIFVSSDAFDNSALLHEQLEVIRLVTAFVIRFDLGCKINAPCGEPIPLYDALIG